MASQSGRLFQTLSALLMAESRSGASGLAKVNPVAYGLG